MATMNVSLPAPMKDWVEAQAKTGRYSNASDYVRDLIRRDQARTDKIAEMQRFVDDGFHEAHDSAGTIRGRIARSRAHCDQHRRTGRAGCACALCRLAAELAMSDEPDQDHDPDSRLVAVTLDEESIGRSGPDIEHERAIAIYDLIEQNGCGRLDQ